MTTRTIKVDNLSRIEGDGSLVISFKNRKAELVEFCVFEPPRFFEAFLQGRSRSETPDITARICGVSPVGYQITSCMALEAAARVLVEDRGLRDLRRLLYCAEWIESHALHTFMLHAPDFLGHADAIAMAHAHPDMVKVGLRLKKIGNELMRVIGGREIHPVNLCVGGFYRPPQPSALKGLLADLAWGGDAAADGLRWMADFRMPQFERDYTLLALRGEGEYPMCEGRVVTNRGLDIDASEFQEHVRETHVERSSALHALLHGEDYLTGPLARFNLNFDGLSERARQVAVEANLEPPVLNPFRSLLVRMVEMVHAFDEAVRLVGRYEVPARPRVDIPVLAGSGSACTEAPRGILFQRFEVDAEGLIRTACIIPPTSQNQASIEGDLRLLADRLIDMPHDEATSLAEQAVRNYDPCLSCSTHYLTLKARASDGPAAVERAGG